MHHDAAKGLLQRIGLGRHYLNLWWINRVRSQSSWLSWNEQHRAVFIHVPKNAGSSIYRMFDIPEPVETHCTALGYRSAKPQLWDECFTFAISRNPWDRFVSAFHYLKQKPVSQDDKDWSQRMLTEFETFADFERGLLASPSLCSRVLMWRHFTPQWYFLCDFGGKLMVSQIARLERLDEDLQKIGETIGIAPQPVRVNAAQRSDYTEYYSQAGRELIGQLYQKDVELFDYSFGETA